MSPSPRPSLGSSSQCRCSRSDEKRRSGFWSAPRLSSPSRFSIFHWSLSAPPSATAFKISHESRVAAYLDAEQMKTSKRRLLAITNSLAIFLLLLLAGMAFFFFFVHGPERYPEVFQATILSAPNDNPLKRVCWSLYGYVFAIRNLFPVVGGIMAFAAFMLTLSSVTLWRSAGQK